MAKARNNMGLIGNLQQTTDRGNTIDDGDYFLALQANGFLISDLATGEQLYYGVDGIAKNDSTGFFNQQIIFEEITQSATLIIPNESGTLATIEKISKGFINKTTTEINAIASPVEGEQYYNTTLHTICFYNGTNWQKVTSTNM